MDSGGVRRGYVRAAGWQRVTRGVHRETTDVANLRLDLDAWKLVLPPSGAFTHLTAAQLFGWWLPPLPADLPVFAAMSNQEPRPRRDGLIVCRHTQPFEVTTVDGLPVTTPVETLLACARDLGLLDLVVLLDAALHLGSCTVEEVADVAALRRRGSPKLRRALPLSDRRAESAWEVLLRMLHVASGVPVEPQLVLRDEGGGFVARGDLWIEGTTTLHEYDGGEHRKKGRHRKDLARERRIGNEVWTRRGYTDAEVLRQGVLILRDADRSLGRPHRPERIRAWHALLADSLFTPSGTARLRRRWGLPPESGHEQQLRGA